MAPEDTNEVACEKPTEEENVETGEQDISNKENTEDVASVENKKKKKKKKKKKGMKTDDVCRILFLRHFHFAVLKQ